jgi:hypothetical protein
MEVLFFVTVLITGIIGTAMADNRNRSKFGGFALGFFLGLIGIAIIALMGHKEDSR